jgi:hypothetical protein
VAAVLALVAAVLALVFPSASLAQRSDLLLAALVLATALGISSSDPARLRRHRVELVLLSLAPGGFGQTRDGDYFDYFVKVKRREWQAAHEQITNWELERYLQLF